jgi:transcriptional regulator with XRE-family HTH domain
MASGILGKRIKELRLLKQATQEELGKAVGVTTQAVSKWECGGVPDAELLPAIADYLGVTIDSLYGRTDEIKQDLELAINYELSHLPEEERYKKAFHYCWSIILGLMGSVSKSLSLDFSNIIKDESNEFYSRIIYEQGIAVTRLSKHCHYFFLMPETEKGNAWGLADTEEYRLLFEALSQKDVLKLILFLYHRKNYGFTIDYICKNLAIKNEDVNAILIKLCNYQIVFRQEVETEDGKLVTYFLNENPAILPFLLFAREVLQPPQVVFPQVINRDRPLI